MISYSIIKETLQIPLKYKNHGIFQGKLIAEISPSLGSYMSDYGYAFNQPVPLFKKLKNYLTIYRPTWLRRYSYRFQHHFQKLTLPEELSSSMVEGILDLNMPIMSCYFKISKIKNKDLFIRISTIEYLFNHFKKLQTTP
jgi:asparagine synthase (glutamine-hydrolysing)